ncbi:MAG TPA: SCP2 sterol-binding domain-containing protein [Usitatibacteraceae bacterium]|nr:SCP2 sterol-binding domain-containing protein [Usitatibacteraceae bacterium]
MRATRVIGAAAFAAAAGAAVAAPELMSEAWAKAACDAWNADATLTAGLYESGWAANDKKRGYKALQVVRKDCTSSPKVELRISAKDGKALCVSGGRSSGALDLDVDYSMTAETRRWIEMGKGEYGPMRAMMFGRLGFDGPMGEAMGNMGPFESFLLLVGKVPGDTAACPK